MAYSSGQVNSHNCKCQFLHAGGLEALRLILKLGYWLKRSPPVQHLHQQEIRHSQGYGDYACQYGYQLRSLDIVHQTAVP